MDFLLPESGGRPGADAKFAGKLTTDMVGGARFSVKNWRRYATRSLVVLCWTYAAACAAGALLIRVAAERWWPATFLLFAPRWIWALPLVVLLPAAALLRRRLLWIVAPTAAFVVFVLMGFCIPWRTWRPHPAAAVSFRLLTCNVHAHQIRNDVLEELVDSEKPDVLALQDFWPRHMPEFLRQPGWYTHRDDELFLASRYPISGFEDIPIHAARPEDHTPLGLPSRGMAGCYTIQLPPGPITLVSLHLASAHQGLSALAEDSQLSGQLLAVNTRRRQYESLLIRDFLSQKNGPVVLAGDFNTPDDSPLFRDAWSGYRDAFTTAGFGLGITYAKHATALRIDHVLCNPGWSIRSCRVGPDVGSGHRALIAELQR